MFKPSMSIPSCHKNVKMLIFYRGVSMEDWGHVDLKLDEFMKKNNNSFIFWFTYLYLITY